MIATPESSLSPLKKELVEGLVSEAKHEAGKKAKAIEDEAKETADKKAKKILALAVERMAFMCTQHPN